MDVVFGTHRYLELQALAYAECSGVPGNGQSGVAGVGVECIRTRHEAEEARREADSVNVKAVANESLGEFRMVMCRELNSIPRESCKR